LEIRGLTLVNILNKYLQPSVIILQIQRISEIIRLKYWRFAILFFTNEFILDSTLNVIIWEVIIWKDYKLRVF